MAEPERDAPLVKTAVTLTRDQWNRLRALGKVEDRSVSWYVRTAIEQTYPERAEAEEKVPA
jgi:predicted DNA-binding protein